MSILPQQKNPYIVNGKYHEANIEAIHALKLTLNDDYLFKVSNFASAFIVWNTLSSHGEQISYDKGRDSDEGSDIFNIC